MVVARKKVDSLKQQLSTTKGDKRIDCLNLLADTYFWIWDENDKVLDTACIYTDQAYELAKKSTYKKGLGYATLYKAHCFAGRTDLNINNNNTENNYLQAEKWSQQAFKIGEQIKDSKLIGEIYNMLIWMERWRGSNVKYKEYLEKAIYHHEKPITENTCGQCKENEKALGSLYQRYAQILSSERKDLSVIKSQIDKAVFYHSKNGNKWGLAVSYHTLGLSANQSINLEAGTEYLLKAAALFKEVKNPRGELDVRRDLCAAYWNMGDFENGLSIARGSLTLAEKMIRESYAGSADSLRLGQVYYWLGRFYEIAGDYNTSFAFFNKAFIFYPPNTAYSTQLMVALGELHRKNGNYDSAKVYLMQFEKRDGGKPMLANLYVSLKQYDDALRILSVARELPVNRNNNLALGRNFLILANAYLGKNNLDQALTHARQGVEFLGQMKRNVYLPDGYKVLSDVFDKLGKTDSAFHYFKKYSSLRDSLLNRQFYFRLSDYKKEAEDLKRIGKINLLEKDNLLKSQQLQQHFLLKEQNQAQLILLDQSNEIKDQQLLIKDQSLKEQTLLKEQKQSQLTLSDKENKLKDQRLKQQVTIRNALLGGLLLFILLGVFVFRNLLLKRKNEKLAVEKRQVELQQKVGELEMQALRAQMNPHFIFNCLNSINRFIFKNETTVASDYLTRFSRLIRMVLLHSQKKLVPLEDELDMLKLYLDMERLRFKNAFDYHITTTNAIENSSVFIPPLLLQPFCENAIWHGLMHKDGQGHLNIQLNEEDGILNCSITDDGVGREKAEEFKSKSAEKEKSMGLKITKERLSLLNQGTTGGTFYKIEDITNEQGEVAGTRVNLQIHYKEFIEEMAL